MDSNNVLGEFLRARRELVRPEDVGLRGGGLRRVPGLRREEVATLAGISSDYYLRLEQGRDRNPSVQVLEALARVLSLDADATRHLVGLTGTGRRPGPRSRRAAKPAQVPASIRQLIDGWPTNPAYVQDRYTDVLAANALGRALSSNYVPGVNLLRTVFLDPAARELHRDWEDLTAGIVASVRARAGADVDDPRLVELVGELSIRSERFRVLWGRHDVVPMRSRVSKLSHPQVGDLDLYCDKLDIGTSDGLLLVVFHAEPGSRDAELLGLLGSLNAPEFTGYVKADEQGQPQRHSDAPGVDEPSDDGS
ncbi:helix-turn-helix domain-containing protein [Streptomyces sp. NPDC000878]